MDGPAIKKLNFNIKVYYYNSPEPTDEELIAIKDAVQTRLLTEAGQQLFYPRLPPSHVKYVSPIPNIWFVTAKLEDHRLTLGSELKMLLRDRDLLIKSGRYQK